MSDWRLIYFADPMCSWCWGFAATIDAIRSQFGPSPPIRLIMGGLRPGTTEPMTEAAKVSLRGHWAHVTEASGQPFGPSGVDGEGFVYDTDPAARAVVAMRRNDPANALTYLHAVQRAFYAGGVDVTDPAALGRLAAEFGQIPDTFAAELATDSVKEETWRDYAIARGAGVSGFPTLILGPAADNTYAPIARGFQPPSTVIPAIAGVLAAAGA